MLRPLLLATLAIPCTLADAGLVSRDLFEPGDGLLTYDPVSGKEWLDFSVSSALLAETDWARLELPPELSEFRVAALGDVEALMVSAQIELFEPWNIPNRQGDPADRLIQMLGATGQYSRWGMAGFTLSGGFVADEETGEIAKRVEDAVAVVIASFRFGGLLGGLDLRFKVVGNGGYYRLPTALYPFVDGPLEIFSTPDPSVDVVLGGQIVPIYADLDGDGVIDDDEIAATFIDYADPYEYDPYLISFQGFPAYWLYRDAAPVPEPAGAALVVAACLGALRLRGLA
ncbi:hypothetical protein [Botrimarina sp.]|uniref:hypothetical protein n=1 Tax=Botrimarina sp. TaxID=2795802 RepID=UPI0032EE9EF6